MNDYPQLLVRLAQAFENGEDCGFAFHDALVEAGYQHIADWHFRNTANPDGVDQPGHSSILPVIILGCPCPNSEQFPHTLAQEEELCRQRLEEHTRDLRRGGSFRV